MTKEQLCQVLFILENHYDCGMDENKWRSNELDKLTKDFNKFVENYRGPISIIDPEKLVESMEVIAKGVCDDHGNRSDYAGMDTYRAKEEALKILKS